MKVEKDKEGSHERVRRNWLLLKQMNRINESQSVGSQFFISCVDNLEINLWPELSKSDNKIFMEKLSKIEKMTKESIKMVRPNSINEDHTEDVNMILFRSTKDKFRVLMELMDKEGLLRDEDFEYDYY